MAGSAGQPRKQRFDRRGICVVCDGEFVGHANRKICSAKCRTKRRAPMHKKKAKRLRATNPEKYKTMHYKSRYGITYDQAQRMLKDQDGQCAICKAELDFFSDDAQRKLHIDHCHDSGKVRGILCRDCNLVIGLAKDTHEILLAAAEYLKCSQ